MLPATHSEFLATALPKLEARDRILGIAAAGSYVSFGLDEFSDLDLVIVVSDLALTTDRARRTAIAEDLGDLIACFTGEHVGVPQLLICLYGPWLLHVDLKFTTLEGFRHRVEDPAVLHDPTGQLARVIQEFPGHYPEPDIQWAEDRMWIWIDYAAQKLRRGELLTAQQSVQFVLERVIGPMLLMRAGVQPNQLRRLEQVSPPELETVRRIAACSDRAGIKQGLHSLADLYAALRNEMGPGVTVNGRAETESRRFLAES
jgi:hypothetical protein